MKLFHIVSVVLTSCFIPAIDGQVSAPQIGAVRYSDGTVWSVYGVTGNLVMGRQFLAPADAVSFSDFGGLVSNQGRIRLIGMDGSVIDEYDSGELTPLLSVTGALTTAVAWLPSRQQLLRWNGRSLVISEVDSANFGGRVISIEASDARSATLLATSSDRSVSEIVLSTDNGAVVSTKPLPGIQGDAFQQQSSIVFWDDHALNVRAANGKIRTLPLPARGITFERAGSDWVHLTCIQHWPQLDAASERHCIGVIGIAGPSGRFGAFAFRGEREMRLFLTFVLFCAGACAQNLSFFVDTTNGGTACSEVPTQLSPLSASVPYQFPDTSVGSSNSLFIEIVNTSTSPVFLATVYVGASAGSSVTNPNFTITGLDQSATIAPGSCSPFTLTFAPVATGMMTGYLQTAYSVNQIGGPAAVTTLLGNGTPPQLPLTCSGAPSCTTNPLQPSTTISFGTITAGNQLSVTFTLANLGSSTVTTPTVALQTQQFVSSPFALNISALPSTLAPNASGTFTITFAPAQAGGPFVANLVVGSNSYQVEGVVSGSSVTPPNSDPPQSWYTDAAGVKTYPNPATPINFTPAAALGANSTATLKFIVFNPNPAGTSFADITLPSPPSVTGSSFAVTNLALAPQASGVTGTPAAVQPGQPVDIPPGWALTFQVVFTAGQQGSAGGTLTIPGIATFTLQGTTAPPLELELICGTTACPQTLQSDQQVNATLQLPANAQAPQSFSLGMAFTSSIKGIADDAAISFISPFNARTIPSISFAQGSAIGTYQAGESQFTFQTGTTAGTITFTATDNQTGQIQTWTVNIPGTPVHFTSTSAQLQPPSLVVTLNGYDNTYSADNASFTFYDTSGNLIPSSPVPENILASDFHQYFFGPSDAGGMFGLQATFPVASGSANLVGSVTVTLTNSAGTTSATKINFQ